MPTVPSLLILGTDAVLAAAPSTAVQLTHACLAAGYDAVIPASWGDELIAARAVERARSADHPVVQCSCPVVANRLAAHGDAIAPMVVCLVPPPVATANYVRALYAPTRPRITYAGNCPGAASEAIDEWLTVDGLLALLASRGISIPAQPTEFGERLVPDRRRFHSDPGGMPAVPALRGANVPPGYVDAANEDFVTTLADHLLASGSSLVDPSGSFGCVCSGVLAGQESARSARARVRELEPPRAPGPVLDHSVRVVLDAELPAAPAARVPQRTPASAEESLTEPSEPPAVATEPRRRSPTGTRKSILGAMPQARADAGRQLPRAYVARRRSSPRDMQAQPATPTGVRLVARHWPYIAAAGVGIGLALAWLMGLGR